MSVSPRGRLCTTHFACDCITAERDRLRSQVQFMQTVLKRVEPIVLESGDASAWAEVCAAIKGHVPAPTSRRGDAG
jgi:hypothetical protein